jgi:hypothetical protein
MLDPADIAMLRQMIREELERYAIKRKPPADITEKRRAAARKMLANRAAKRANAEQMLPVAQVNGRAHRRANAEQNRANAEQIMQGNIPARIWDSYAQAYRARYRADPVCNAKVNAQVVQLARRIGEDAVAMAAWFLSHGASRYVQAGHSIGALLMDCEKLHTEWQTGRRVTSTSALQSDRTQATGDVIGRLIEEVRRDGKLC